ncbi:hypothetical protein GIB67_017216 [Kingdonia uniflora]|uniref:Uncharacterized protein n=1 Tax=Kingdonia uniflora TaxID=39325 RepID=A0A7J7NKF0_9MAGN|nr:hypothetical protein GIB67_017216 [Kingdonia uniflora]
MLEDVRMIFVLNDGSKVVVGHWHELEINTPSNASSCAAASPCIIGSHWMGGHMLYT